MTRLQPLITQLKKIDLSQDEHHIIACVKPLVKHYITQPDLWLEDRFYDVDLEQGFGSHLIYENTDHTLAVIVTSWPSRRETPPHDHGTWAVIGCVIGAETNVLWNRLDNTADPCKAKITHKKIIACKPGDIVTMCTEEIHSVFSPLENSVSISLHVYGKHFNYTNRKKFNPETGAVEPFIVQQS